MTYDNIVRAIKQKNLERSYLLSGEEPLFIDKLADLFAREVVPEDERDFNQTILYGNDKDLTLADVVSEAMRFPMMSERSLVILREAQLLKDIDHIAPYLNELPETTCLVICYKKKADKRKALYKTYEQIGTHYESQRLSDTKVPSFISSSFAEHHLTIDPRTAQMMADHTGNDLEKILGEVDKLSILLPKGTAITPELIEQHIGISKEYNNFELLSAIVHRDAPKAFRIAYYFSSNEKNYPIQMILPILFNYFAQLMAVYYLPQKDERSIAQNLGINPYMARDYEIGVQNYRASSVFNIIRQIRTSDAQSKGVDATLSSGEILKDLISYIFAV